MAMQRIEHVQLAMPAGEEDTARRFYAHALVHYFRDSYSNFMRIRVDDDRQDNIGSTRATRTGAQGKESDLGSRRLQTG